MGAISLTVSVLALNWADSMPVVVGLAFLAGLGAGLFIVPIDAFIQIVDAEVTP